MTFILLNLPKKKKNQRGLFFVSRNSAGICGYLCVTIPFDSYNWGEKNVEKSQTQIWWYGTTGHFPCLNIGLTCESWAQWQMAWHLSWDLGYNVGLDRNWSSMWLLTWARVRAFPYSSLAGEPVSIMGAASEIKPSSGTFQQVVEKARLSFRFRERSVCLW